MADRFYRHKKYLLKKRNIATAFSVFSAVGSISLIADRDTVWISLVPLAVFVICMIYIIFINRFLKQFSKIDRKKVCNTVIANPKIAFLTAVEYSSSTAGKSTVQYYGVKIIDKQNYYYFFGECYKYSAEELKEIQEKLNGKLDIQYYEGTTIIKMIQNDPYYLKIKINPF